MTGVDFSEFEFIGKTLLDQRWIFAKTMPENPHWYTLRKEWQDEADFVKVVQFMRTYGYQEIYRGSRYTMLNVNDCKYWTMGAPIGTTILINRKPHEQPSDYDRIANIYDGLFSDDESVTE